MNESTVLALAVALAFLLGLLVGLAVWIRARSSFVREDHARHREHEQVASALREEVAALRQAREADAEKLGWSEKAEERLREAFTALAGETLRKNADSYSSRAKEDIQGVLTPFQEKLVSLDGHVRELEKARAGADESLNSQIRDLKEAGRL